jgi:hypothetical protein
VTDLAIETEGDLRVDPTYTGDDVIELFAALRGGTCADRNELAAVTRAYGE